MSNVKAFYLKGLNNEDKNKHKKYIINRRKSARKGKYLTKKPELKSYKHEISKSFLNLKENMALKLQIKKRLKKKLDYLYQHRRK